MIKTIDDLYTAINPMPAQLTAKGIAKPIVTFHLEANANTAIHMNWKRRYVQPGEFEYEYKTFLGDTVEQALEKARAFIQELPNADQAKLHHFMGALGKLIDGAKDDGIQIDYLNPLLDTMKRLSENVITYKPAAS